jgi:hypothetical protein
MKLMGVVAVASLTCGFVAAPLMAAGIASAVPADCDGAGCVPFVAHNVTQGAYCNMSVGYVFGLDSSGHTLVCASVAKWVPSKPLIGVRTMGAPCSGDPGMMQAPDGAPLRCNGSSWVDDWSEIYWAPAA